jgi:cysteine synthase
MLKGQVFQIIGETPLIKIESLSKQTGCEIFGKAEFLNPGGSVKDRAALGMILQAEADGLLKPGFSIIEGTAGNTGIGLAIVAAQKGYPCTIVMPNNQSSEKYQTLKALGVELITVDPCPFANEKHFYHTARRISEERKNYFWANQFENTANAKAHYETTGAEIWKQTEGQIDVFISAVGTGGTLGGVSKYLKERKPSVHIRLADPFGSGLYSYLKTGQMTSTGTSITEGIGIMRLTANFKEAIIDDAVQISDQDMISMLYHLAKKDGLLVGTSAALNVSAAYQYAMENKNKGLKIVTILCDSALRYQSKIFNAEFLAEKSLSPQPIF